ncbi:MAG: MMPL family transporter, partial [Pirellulales bacterium]|nr:MMPL family transporter [Pirellulales bacterium]
VSQILVVLLTALVLRDVRAVLVLVLLMGGSSIWWFASLRLVGIYLSLFLLFPLVFIICIGTDYALHLFYRARSERIGKARTLPAGCSARIWSTTGRAITAAAITDAGVFLIYSTMELVSGALVLRAMAIAVMVVYFCTLILVPALGWRESPLDERR